MQTPKVMHPMYTTWGMHNDDDGVAYGLVGIKGRDIAMDVHHVTAAWLCIASYMTGKSFSSHLYCLCSLSKTND